MRFLAVGNEDGGVKYGTATSAAPSTVKKKSKTEKGPRPPVYQRWPMLVADTATATGSKSRGRWVGGETEQ